MTDAEKPAQFYIDLIKEVNSAIEAYEGVGIVYFATFSGDQELIKNLKDILES